MNAHERLAFGDFVLQRAQERVLRADGSELALTPRLFKALLLFVDHPDTLLDKDRLMAALWPGLVVEENNLSQTISSLRRALGDEPAGSRYIQTVARRGFRFVAAVTVLPPADVAPVAVAEAALPAAPAVPAAPGAAAAPAAPAAPAAVPAAPAAPAAPAVPAVPAAPGAAAAPAAADIVAPANPHRRRTLALAGAGVALAAGAVAWQRWLAPAAPAAASPALSMPKVPATAPAAAPATAPATARATVAVLPFKPLAAESRDELLELGMADSLITRLSLVPGLVLRSVASVRRYAGGEQDPLRAARELDVDWIVDGALQRRGDQLRVSARLLRADDGSAAWSGSFDARYTGVFDMQDQISARVLQALAPRLQASAGVGVGVGAGAGAGARRPDGTLGGTRDVDAYQLYLAAARHAEPRRAEGLRRSIALFREAIGRDPGYALAHVGLAEALRYTLLSSDAPPAEVVDAAQQAVQRALALAPELAEALCEQGYSLYFYAYDWPGAERGFRRALAANPNVATAHFGLAQLLLTLDRPDEGMDHLRLARELDPMSPFFNALEAGYLLARGQREAARARLQRAFDIAPEFFMAHRTQAMLHLADGQPDAAIASLRRAAEQAGGNSRPQALLGMHLARLGRRAEARALLDTLLERARTGFVPPLSLAVLHAALGDTEPALAALERAYAGRDPQLVFLKDDPRWAPLRQQPRFRALMQALRLDAYGPGLSPT